MNKNKRILSANEYLTLSGHICTRESYYCHRQKVLNNLREKDTGISLMELFEYLKKYKKSHNIKSNSQLDAFLRKNEIDFETLEIYLEENILLDKVNGL